MIARSLKLSPSDAASATVVVGNQSFESMFAEWREWRPRYEPEPRPKGGITVNEYAKLHSIDIESARDRLKRGERDGDLIAMRKKTYTKRGVGRWVTYFIQKRRN